MDPMWGKISLCCSPCNLLQVTSSMASQEMASNKMRSHAVNVKMGRCISMYQARLE